MYNNTISVQFIHTLSGSQSQHELVPSSEGCKPATMNLVLRLMVQYIGLSPFPVTVANEGFGRDSLLKMVHNPGGDCLLGRGITQPIYVMCSFVFSFLVAGIND